jgi:hypothetical protein
VSIATLRHVFPDDKGASDEHEGSDRTFKVPSYPTLMKRTFRLGQGAGWIQRRSIVFDPSEKVNKSCVFYVQSKAMLCSFASELHLALRNQS